MGYIASAAQITIDAILTKKGRELLANGQGFNVTQFAVADDEIDYSLWNPAHPLGTQFYGSAIENLPILEASPDETQNLRYKLVSLPRGTTQIPIIQVGFTNIVLTAGQNTPFVINPSTTSGFNGAGFGYTAVLQNSQAAILVGTGLPTINTPTTPAFLGDSLSANAAVAVGVTFTLTPSNVPTQVVTTLQLIGNETGASITIPVTVNPQPSI